MTIEVFPVTLGDDPSALRATTVTRNGRTRQCPKNRIWYSDWHLARRGARLHHAQDIFAPEGAWVLAPEYGVVVASSADTGPTEKGGHYIRVRAEDGRTYYMAHLMDLPDVRAGEQIIAGQLIARVGRTGNARTTCPHLHIGARLRGRAINLYPELRNVDPTLARRKAGKDK